MGEFRLVIMLKSSLYLIYPHRRKRLFYRFKMLYDLTNDLLLLFYNGHFKSNHNVKIIEILNLILSNVDLCSF